MLEKMEKSDNELLTELANLNKVMSNVGSTPFHHAIDFLPNVYARDFLPNLHPTSTSTLVEPQSSSQESNNVNEDQSQKNYYNFN